MSAPKKVLVGVTGGIDSLVAAFLLKKQGHQVYAAAILNFTKENDQLQGENFLKGCQVANLEDIQALLASFHIKLYAVRGEDLFYDQVVEKLVSAKLSVDDYIPCFDCTRLRLQLLLEKAQLLKLDAIATGHFAKVHFDIAEGRYKIHRANDARFDQSHLLSLVDQEVLSRLLLPLGDTRKEEVERLAERFGLNSLKKPYQGHCFSYTPELGSFFDYFLDDKLSPEGNLINAETEGVLGEHPGIHHLHPAMDDLQKFMGGQTLDKKLSVITIDPKSKNAYLSAPAESLPRQALLKDYHPIGDLDLAKPHQVTVKFLSSEKFFPALISFKSAAHALLEWQGEVQQLLPGQSVVLFDKDRSNAKLIGYGIIHELGDFATIHRARETEEVPLDEDGNELPLVGKDFEF